MRYRCVVVPMSVRLERDMIPATSTHHDVPPRRCPGLGCDCCRSGGLHRERLRGRARTTGSSAYAPLMPQVRLSVVGQCPDGLGKARDVSNPSGGLTDRLVPKDAIPRSGLVCQYCGQPDPTSRTTLLVRRTVLDRQNATRLADALREISLKAPSGKFACPAGLFGAVTIIVVSYYGHRANVDLWYSTSSCQTIDNAHVEAFQGANPTFYDRFETIFGDVTPAR